jgi:hypothetical protein
MNLSERDRLAAHMRRVEGVAKTAAKQRSKELLAQMEEELSAVFSAEDELWRDVTREAMAFVREADARIAAICRERGVREEFRPSLNLGWSGRGQNASQVRRAELRRLGQSRVAALEAAAITTIEKKSIEIQGVLVSGGLQSDEARAFMASMPTVEALMPPLKIDDLQKGLPERGPDRTLGYREREALGLPAFEDTRSTTVAYDDDAADDAEE